MGLDRSPEQLIKTGLVALKQQNYKRAIATFQKLRQDQTLNISYRLKAQMGLIRTYEAQGKIAQAEKLCQPLLQSSSSAIRQWGQNKLQQISAQATTTGVQPPKNIDRAPVPETSGFIPLSGPAEIPAISESVASNTHIPNTQYAANQVPEETATPDNTATQREEKIHPPTTQVSEGINNLDGEKRTSLFHYHALNDRNKIQNETLPPGTDAETTINKRSFIDSKNQTQEELAASVERITSKQNRLQTTTTSTSYEQVSQGPETWPTGERLKQVKSLGKVGTGRLWFTQLTTIALLFWVVRWLVQTTLLISRSYVGFLNNLLPLRIPLSPIFWQPHTWTVVVSLGLLTLASSWLWPILIGKHQTLPSEALKEYSPEAEQLLKRLCAKRRWQLPTMAILPTDIPLIFSGGWRPRYGRLMVSQGLLDCVVADELAALLMYEMSHWGQWDWVFFSTHGLLVQIFHRGYWFLAQWGKSRPIFLKASAGFLANLSYGVFWLLLKLGCGLSRTRVPYRDRSSTEITGNPNGLLRALAKLSKAMHQTVEATGYTPPLLESLELMLPVGPTEAASVHEFAWGALHPLRHWFAINKGHPPLGDRLYTLGAYSRHWRLKPSVNFARLQLKYGKRSVTRKDWQTLILWSGLWSGAVIGLATALCLWIVGAIATVLDFSFLAWLYRDRSILMSMPLIGAGTVQLLRVNPLFPEIPSSLPVNEPTLTDGQADIKLTPLSSLPIKVNGTLTGRPALANWLGQEWRLNTASGSIKLAYVTYWGPLSHLRGLSSALHQSLQVTGWFRRGHRPWIDIERFNYKNSTEQAQHPQWSVIVSIGPLLAGVWLLISGG
ncbi:MAG: M48 family metalloprotease [Cyanobacteria bacterium P01_D01_bin.156]